MGNERDFRAEYEALLKQYEEDKKREQEVPQDFADENKKEKIDKRNKIISSVVLILFLAMIASLLIGKSFLEPLTLFGIAFLFFGLIIFAMRLFKDPIFAVTSLILFMVSAISTFCGNPMMMFAVIPGIFACSLLSTTITNTKPLIQLLRKMKPLKQACTEKATAICINPNQRDRNDLLKEKIEVIPYCKLVVKRRGSGLNSKTSYGTEIVHTLFSPIYELDYYGTKHILYDNYYSITPIEKGESREILINPENPEEFYDIERYKSDAWQILKTIPIFSPIIVMTIFIIFIVLFNDSFYGNLG